MTKNGQNMAKMEKIRNIQMTDNKEDKFFYFPMISMPCTGSGYPFTLQIPCKSMIYKGFFLSQGVNKALILGKNRKGEAVQQL